MFLLTLKDKQFKLFIPSEKIQEAVKKVAAKINTELHNEFPLFLVVLNGAFMFASDLLKEINIPCEISFIKVSSYTGTSSSGNVSELIGLNEDVNNRTVVIVEDIVDTGNTLERIIAVLNNKKVKQFKIAAAFLKPSSFKKNIKLDYVGLSLKFKKNENDFVVGYGLDYDGLGRNEKSIYVLA